jgi:hypothetical protein
MEYSVACGVKIIKDKLHHKSNKLTGSGVIVDITNLTNWPNTLFSSGGSTTEMWCQDDTGTL